MKEIEHIVVLCGGPSGEHEVSLNSGRSVEEALRVHFPRVDRIEVGDRCPALPPGVQCVFNVIHGEYGEDGTLQAELEKAGIPYVGSDSASSRLAMDKISSKRVLAKAGVPVLPDWVIEKGDPIPAGLTIPAVVKPGGGGSSIGVHIVRSADDLEESVEAAFGLGSRVLVEPYFSGREFTVAVWGDRALPIVEVRPRAEFYDYRVKYTAGCTDYLVPAPLPDSVAERFQRIGLSAHRALGCRHLSRVDMLWNEETDQAAVLEVNTLPGFTSTSLFPKAANAAGVAFPELCRGLVFQALEDFAEIYQ
jgi:D-alanine-D-alanine ligase